MTVKPGEKYGRLTVLEKAESMNGFTRWVCQCECGNLTTARGINLTSGHTKSCGCIAKEYHANQHSRRTHGLKGTRLYNAWCNMKSRCYNPKNENYYLYGERGIGVCDEWKNNFEAFAKWSFENGYKENLTIDRIDNYKGYSPDNCRWTTAKVQVQNRRPIEEWPSTIRQIEAIHQKCLTCVPNVEECKNESCTLYPYRMGHNPSRKGKGGKFAPKSPTQVGESDDAEIEETWYTALDDEKISAVEEGYGE